MVCSPQCAIAYSKTIKKKLWKKEKFERKEKIKTKSDHLAELQAIFNEFIRLRDRNEPCISCGTTKPDIKYDAGHFHSVKAYPSVRVYEDNVHKQCSNYCNVHLSGNSIKYRENLIIRIGQERFDELERVKNIPLNLTIDDIKKLKQHYRQKVKEFKKCL